MKIRVSCYKSIEVPYEAEIFVSDKTSYYTKDWQRKSDCQLIDEGLMQMPEGFIREKNELRPMTQEERITSGLAQVPSGFKLSGKNIVEMSLQEKLKAGLITKEVYEQQLEAENTMELQRRLMALQTPEILAQADIDEKYAAERKLKLASILAVKKQQKWPLEVSWPE